MAENNEPKTVCVSVFKSGESTTTEREFTEMWTSLINTLERSKSGNFCEKAWLKESFMV